MIKEAVFRILKDLKAILKDWMPLKSGFFMPIFIDMDISAW